MNHKQTIDILISLASGAAGLTGWFYAEGSLQLVSAALGLVLVLLFLILAFHDGQDRSFQSGAKLPAPFSPTISITEVVLLNEEDQPMASWPLYGKVSLVIGRDVGENQVDINLNNSTYASMIDIEHAALNYTAGSWYVEDLASKNGVSIQAKSDGRKYKLAPDQPCRLHSGDILFIGLTRLLLR